MSKAVICYRNLLEEAATVVASSASEGYSAANAYNGRLTTYWRPADDGVQTLTATFLGPVSVDYFACYRHNLASAGATIQLQYSTNGGASWLDAFAPVALADNQCYLRRFTVISAASWRVRLNIAGAVPCMLGVVAIGPGLVTARGMAPGFVVPRQGRNSRLLNNVTEGGLFAGRSLIAAGFKSDIDFAHVPRAWVRQYWEPFLRHAELKPFFFSWNHEDYPGDAAFCWVPDGKVPTMPLTDDFYQRCRLPIACLLSDGI